MQTSWTGTSPERPRRRIRRQQSLRQEYAEFILQRIEEFKQQISREELLTIADEAVRELEVGPEEQLVLTEVLMLEHVDRLITRRLNLPTYRRWRVRHLKLRRAQREPTHWGIEVGGSLVELAQHLDYEGDALVVGAGAVPAALFLAAHDWPVTFIDPELSVVETAETRAATEALAYRFHALVVSLGTWFPDVTPMLVVIDSVTLGRLDASDRQQFLDTLTARTMPGGMHLVLPHQASPNILPLAPEVFKAHYAGWHIERRRSDATFGGLVAVKR